MHRVIPWLAAAGLAVLLAAEPAAGQPPALWQGRSPVVPRPAAAHADSLPFAGLPMREIADLIDGVGQAVDEPGVYELALRTVASLAGSRHPFAGYLHIRLAGLLYRHGDRAGALAHALEGEAILRDQLELDLRGLSSAEALRLARQRESALDLLLTLASTEPSAAARARCWDSFLRSRALVLDELASRRRAVDESGDTTLAQLADALTAARERLAAESFRAPDPGGRSLPALAGARTRVDSLERELGRRSRPFRDRLAHARAGLDEVRAALAPGDALLAYAYYLAPPARPPVLHSESYRFLDRVEKAPRAAVLAFVLRSGEAAPATVPLARAVELDSLIELWRTAVRRPPASPADADRRDREARRLGELIRKRVWDPVAPALAGAKRILVVTDGALQLVSLGALPAPDSAGRYLIERTPALCYLSAERDLVRPTAPRTERSRLVAMGGVRSAGDSVAAAGVAVAGLAAVPMVRATACGERRDLRFPWLPASEREASDAADLWCASRAAADGPCDARLLVGWDATKRRFVRESAGASVLHLSTHGFFLTCSERATPTVSWRPSRTFDLAPPPAGTDSPLLCTGLLFSDGAGPQGPPGGAADRLLTAEEVGALDLSQARVVVLSACETGVGVLEAREGLLGLRRSFEIAGAGGLVVSLWPVDDRRSRAFMRGLYAARFGHGTDLPTAVRDASLAELAAVREQGLGTSPADWGAFVVVGIE